MLSDPHNVERIATAGETIAAQFPRARDQAKARATAYWLRGEARYRLDDSVGASPLIATALRLVRASSPGSKLEGDILLTSGSVHGERAEVAAALADLQQAHTIFVRVGDARSQAISLVCLSTLYKDAKDYGSALRYLREALDAYQADPKLAWSIQNNRGVILQRAGRYKEADVAFAAAARLSSQIRSPQFEEMLLRNRARNNLLLGRLAVADDQIRSARRLSARAGGDDSILWAVAAQAALQHGRADDAAELIDRAFVDVDLATTTPIMREAHKTAYDVFSALHQNAKALAHLTALKRLDDESTKLATETSSALMSARFDSANQETKIARLRDAERLRVADDALQRARAERTLLLLGGGAGLVIMALLAAGIVVLRRSRDQVRSVNADLAVTNGALGKALAAKTEFLATTSHEIRTPLNGILGMTQVMLADTGLNAATRDRLTVVHGAGVTMRALVDDILDVAKMETGNLGLECAPFDLTATLRDVTVLWTEQARAKGLAFTVDLDRCPRHVEGDVARVRQVLFNLLSNALKFTAQGSIAVVAEGIDGGVRIKVVDTGIGIDPSQHATVFESFRQADTSTTRRFGGTGLGLSICRNLIEAMGGEVSLASVPGQGSTFTVTLPLREAAVQPPVDAASTAATLLIVDRNPIARAMFRTLFTPHWGNVAFAGTIAEVAAVLGANEVTQVLIDDATARASGDAPGFIGAIVATTGSVPISLLWPVATTPERDALLALGVDRVIVKPIAGAALVKVMYPPHTVYSPDRLVSQAA